MPFLSLKQRCHSTESRKQIKPAHTRLMPAAPSRSCPIASNSVSAMNIHDVHDRHTDDRRQTSSLINAPT